MPDAPLTYATSPGRKPGTTILVLRGPLTLQNLFGFQNEFRALTPPTLIVDLSGVDYIDSAGLGLLMNGYVSAQNHGRRYMVCGVSPRVGALLEVTRVDTLLSPYPSVEAAEHAA